MFRIHAGLDSGSDWLNEVAVSKRLIDVFDEAQRFEACILTKRNEVSTRLSHAILMQYIRIQLQLRDTSAKDDLDHTNESICSINPTETPPDLFGQRG